MPWCPKCKAEYRKSFTECTECGEPLVAALSDAPAEADTAGAVLEECESFDDEVFLANLSGPIEISYITSMLEEQGIPYRLMEGDIGQYLSAVQGVSFFGEDVYIAAKNYERAAEIVKSFKEQAVAEDGEEQ